MRKTVAAVAVLSVLVAALFIASPSVQKVSAGELKVFSSVEELTQYVQINTELFRLFGYFGENMFAVEDMLQIDKHAIDVAPRAISEAGTAHPTADYSTTNVQVEGVDEGDIVKSDGRYLYVLSGNKAAIVEAYPAESARLVSKIIFTGNPREMFVNKNRLVVFGNKPGSGNTFVQVYDTTDKENPVLKKDIFCRGSYVTSRMIGDYVYVIISAPVVVRSYVPKQESGNQAILGQKVEQKVELPQFTVDGQTRIVPPTEIHYFDYSDANYCYTIVLSLNTQNGEVKKKTFLTGISQNIYASAQNIYLTGVKMPDIRPLVKELTGLISSETQLQNAGEDLAQLVQKLSSLDDRESNALMRKIRGKWQTEIARRNRTVIHKLAVANGEVTYRCSGDVPGRVLNQFSMDEHKGMFRIATTSHSFLGSWRLNTHNNVYVLDENLQVVGRLQGLAPSERIYAARFMGERAYLVTFRHIDPLFVVDLKDPRQPKILGELKIPGYSEYLHPYDENYLIGIGREIPEVPESFPGKERERILPPPPREQGVKIALFDVRDPAKPKEIAKYVIPGENADSAALKDHKAVLFSREKHLLAIPVSYMPVYRRAEAMPPETRVLPRPPYGYWYGVYVFDVSLENGLQLKGKITHTESGPGQRKDAGSAKRSLYINDILYTVSDLLIKMNDLGTLKEINEIWLG